MKKRRTLNTGKELLKTPLLVPSFSSKGFPQHLDIMEVLQESLFSPTLISAYDIYYEQIVGGKAYPLFNSLPLIIVDSGGYEANPRPEFSDTPKKEYQPRTWAPDFHTAALGAYQSDAPLALVTYDHPDERHSFDIQVKRAQEFQAANSARPIIFLLKPETPEQNFVQIDALRRHINGFDKFAAIGVTEDESGRSLLDRMIFITQLRQSLDAAGLELPIHVFGSLDTLLTFMYFTAGADIFDGLTWLRHAFMQDNTLYRRHFPILTKNFTRPWELAEAAMWQHNYVRLVEMQEAMLRYADSGDFGQLPHGELVRQAFDTMQARLRS